MLNNRQDARAREARLKKPIVFDLSKIDITKRYLKKPTNDQLSFNKREVDPHLYPGVLIVLMPVAEVIILEVLVDTGSSINILFTNTSWYR